MKNILLIDDDKAIHNLVNAILDPQHFKVTSALDPTQAFTFVRREKPDLILLDIKMPAGGGFELFKRFKSIPKTSSIPVIVLSALSKEEIEKTLASHNTMGILTKPVVKEELVRCVTNTLKIAS